MKNDIVNKNNVLLASAVKVLANATFNYYNKISYTFSGKEKDIETDYSYFGARYYNSDFSIWLSVDMMSDKYPHLSGYNYCELNPVMLIDPDGNSSGRPDDYFTKNDEYLGSDKKYGSTTDNIRIIDKKTWNYIENADATNEKKLDTLTNSNISTTLQNYVVGVNFSYPEQEKSFKPLAQGIANHYYKQTGYSLGELKDGNIYLFSRYKDGNRPLANGSFGEMFGLEKGKFNIGINPEDFGDKLNNKWDFVNIYIHERKSHGGDFKKGIPYVPYSYEQRAYRMQMRHSSWRLTSPAFKRLIKANALEYNVK